MKTIISKIITEISRIILGVTFIFSGMVKAIDPIGGAYKIEDYLAAFGLSAFNRLAYILSLNLAAFEFFLGLCVLMAVYRKAITFCTLALMSFMTLLTLYLAIFNPVHDCGCFGDAFILTNWETFFKNLFVLLPASIIIFIFHKRMTQVYSYKVSWFIALFAYLFPVFFGIYNNEHLPVKDFRPYKTGANIPQAMSFPEGAARDEYAFIYEKDGRKETFTMENLPTDDSTWTYVDAKLIKQGYIPPVTTFELYNDIGDNIADEILSDTAGIFLLVSPRIEKASDKKIDDINNIYDYSLNKSMQFYCITSSGKDNIREWINETGAEYMFLTADETTLKTIIRSNPGLVFIKNGTVLMKWHYNDFPADETLNSTMDELLSPKRIDNNRENNIWIVVISCFAFPLLFVWIYDYFRNRKKGII
jgi:hypothetical protein